MRSKAFLIIAFTVMSHPALAQRAMPFMSNMDTRDKSLWRMSIPVKVGTILHTDPKKWRSKDNAPFSIKLTDLEPVFAKSPPEPVKDGDETFSASTKSQVGGLVSFIQMLGIGYAHESNLKVILKDVTVDYASTDYEFSSALQALDSSKIKSPRARDILYLIQQNARAAKGDPKRTNYWIVKRVYRANNMNIVKSSGDAATFGLGCATIPQTELPITEKAPDAKGPDEKGAADSAVAKPKDAALKPKLAGTVKVSTDGTVGGSLIGTMAGVTGTVQSPDKVAATKATDAKPTSCALMKASLGKAKSDTIDKNAPVFAVQIAPIYLDGSHLRVADLVEYLRAMPRGIIG